MNRRTHRSVAQGTLVLAALALCTGLQAQVLIGTDGGTSVLPNTTISWSVGEPILGTGSTGNGAMSQGYQQPADRRIRCSVNGSAFCGSGSALVMITYSTARPFAPGNVFTAQLSDAFGSFVGPVPIGSVSATGSGTINAAVPAVAPGTAYRLRVVSSAPAIIGVDNGVDLTIGAAVPYYADVDGDGAGDPDSDTLTCAPPIGYVADNTDGCPADPLKSAPGQCGCGEVDTDTDNDLTADCNDGCPTDPTKTWEGICGCGIPDVDGDGNTVMDCLDGCPTDPDKVAPGVCGCGTPDTDTDGDATPDCNDQCPMDPNKTVPGSCGCGQAEPGSACNDGDPLTGNDLVNASCQCVGQPLDCAGVPGGSTLPGTPCDDGDANTINDVYGATCLCAGTPANAGVQLTLSTDAAAAQTSWEIIPQGGGTAVCSGSGYANNSTQVLGCPIVAGCYELRVLDSFGDGMGTGGYVLRDANGQRIIDNAGDGVFTFESRIANNGGFCLPLGTDRLRASRCDLEGLLPTDWVAAEENPAVSAQYGVGNQADDGYQFWFFNPDGGYSRRILVTHASASYLFPAGATRACHLGFAGIITNPLPQQQLLNVRVRSLVNGAYAAFGPACRLRIGAACTTTQLTNNPLSSEHSCGVTRSFGGSDKLFADAVPGANRYRFRFERIGGGFTRMIASSSRVLTLKWNMLPLVAGDSYTVTVAASYDAGATWCPAGSACTVAITAPASAQQRSEVSTSTELLVFPNPTRGDVVNVLADGLPIEATTAELAITDLFGKQVYTGQVPVADGAVRQVIDLSGRTASGVYLVVLRVEGTEQVRRLVVH